MDQQHHQQQQQEALQRLQAELLTFKKQFPDSTLRKARGPGAPWPITVSARVDNATAPAWDVDSLTVELKLHSADVLDLLQPASAAPVEAAAALTSCAVRGPDVPERLELAIGQALQEAWTQALQQQQQQQQPPAGGRSLLLHVPVEALRARFATLLKLVPDLVDSYLTEDAQGRTVRRFMLVSAQVVASATPEHPPQASAPPAQLPAAPTAAPAAARPAAPASRSNGGTAQAPPQPTTAAASPARQPAPTAATRTPSSPASPPGTARPAAPPPVPVRCSWPVLSSELRYIARRYPCQLVPPDGTASATPVTAAEVRSPGALPAAPSLIPQRVTLQELDRALAALHDPHGGHSRPDGAAAAPPPLQLELELLPTDAAWQRGRLLVLCSVSQALTQHAPADAPAAPAAAAGAPSSSATVAAAVAGAPQFAVRLSLSPRTPVPPWLRSALGEELMLQCASAAAGAAAAAAAPATSCAPPAPAQPAAAQQPQQDASSPSTSAAAAAPAGPSPAHARGRRPAGPFGRAAPAASGAAAPLRGALKHLENRAGELEAAAERRARAAGERTALGQSGQGAQGAAWSSPGGTDGEGGTDDSMSTWEEEEEEENESYDSEEAESAEEGDEGQKDEAEEEERGVAGEAAFTGTADLGASGSGAQGAAAGPPAWAVVLEGLQLDTLAAAEVIRCALQVSCARCGTSGTMTVATDAAPAAGGKGGTPSGAHAAQGECAHCHHPWHLVLRSRFLHEHSNVLCVLKPSGLTPVDLLPASVLAAQCSECSHIVTFRNVLAGAPARRPCSSCHRELGLSWLAVSWVPRGAPPGARAGGGGAAGGGAARARAPGGGRGPGRPGPIQAGQPLPALGTCKHYTHSHRWFRFPCCGRAFPCDICHEEQVPDGHEARFAARMICGYCSTEQPVANECRACGKKVATSSAQPSGRNSRFWEGGEGCRDKSRMDPRDVHKYRGSAAKTRSAKHKRVGPKPWSKELKRSAE